MPKILLVGEQNPYGDDPEMALYPLPEYASGARLKEILGVSTGVYLREHDRANLCDGPWSMPKAVERALQIHGEREGCGIVLCGAKVATAFRRAAAYTSAEFTPFSLAEHQGRHYLALPHPSGRNLVWNELGAKRRARRLYEALVCDVGGRV